MVDSSEIDVQFAITVETIRMLLDEFQLPLVSSFFLGGLPLVFISMKVDTIETENGLKASDPTSCIFGKFAATLPTRWVFL